MKKITVLVVSIAFLLAACNSKNEDPVNGGAIDIEALTPEEIYTLPYGSLTPKQQRVKLEGDGSKLIELGDAASRFPALDAAKSLTELSNTSSIKTSGKRKIASIEEIFEYANYFGIYTWDDSKKIG